jgi:hypothetical protein
MTNIKKPKKQPLNIQRGWANNTGDTLYINEDKIYIQGKSINNAAPQIEIDSSTTPNLININAQNINIGTSNSTTNVLGTLLNNGNPISGGGTIIQPDWATENNDLLSIHKDNIKLYNPTKNDPTYIEIGTNENSEINIKASKISLNANASIDVKASNGNITIGSGGSDVNILGTLLNNGQKISNLSNLPIVIGDNNTGTITFSTNQTSMYYKDVCITLGTQTGNYNSNDTGISIRMGSNHIADARVIEIHPEDISIANNATAGVIKIDNSGIKIGNGSVSFTTNTGATVPRAIFDLSKKYIDIYNSYNSSSISVLKLDTTIPLYGATIKNNEIRLGTSSTCAFYANYNPSGTSEIKFGSGTATNVWLADSSASVKMNYNSTAHTITFTDPVAGYSATIQMTKE